MKKTVAPTGAPVSDYPSDVPSDPPSDLIVLPLPDAALPGSNLSKVRNFLHSSHHCLTHANDLTENSLSSHHAFSFVVCQERSG